MMVLHVVVIWMLVVMVPAVVVVIGMLFVVVTGIDPAARRCSG